MELEISPIGLDQWAIFMRSQPNSISSLVLYNPSDGTIIGELSDASWGEEHGSSGTNYVLSGIAGDGTMDTITLFIDGGNDTVRYEFDEGQIIYGGDAFILQPPKTSDSSGTEVRIETPKKPSAVSAKA